MRFEGVVVCADGRTHLFRVASEVYLQWGGTKDQIEAAEDALRALSSALAALQNEDDR
ncbi:hypothetical protein ABT324_00675 [Saccharopolyspora sp. NPDC000359]|uniref:hypothetical protein n=1 Tax=Saccharopolyspora sp. NPDC000359 TaxID=3154251 RepID=UPI003319D72D